VRKQGGKKNSAQGFRGSPQPGWYILCVSYSLTLTRCGGKSLAGSREVKGQWVFLLLVSWMPPSREVDMLRFSGTGSS